MGFGTDLGMDSVIGGGNRSSQSIKGDLLCSALLYISGDIARSVLEL